MQGHLQLHIETGASLGFMRLSKEMEVEGGGRKYGG